MGGVNYYFRWQVRTKKGDMEMSHIGNDAVIDAQRDALDEEEEFQNHLDQCGACPRCENYEDVKNLSLIHI